MHTRWLMIRALGLAVAAMAPGAASGQDALGSGNALDANPGDGRYGFNRPAPVENFRNRNLVVTRDVADGRGFQGTVGYTGEYDFREALGSNDLYTERASSALSNPGLLAAGRTFERLRYGQYLGAVAYRRSGYGSSLASVDEARLGPAALNDDRLTLDQLSLSSTSHMIYESASDAQIVGLIQDDQGRSLVASASSLTGVQMGAAETQAQLIGLTGYDLARTLQDIKAEREISRLGQPFQASFEDLKLTARIEEPPATDLIEPDGAETAIEVKMPPQYTAIMEGVAQRAASTLQTEYAPDAPFLTELEQQMAELRAHLEESEAQLQDKDADQEQADEQDQGRTLKIPDIAEPLRHGQRIERLSTDEQTRFDELIASAEEKLQAGEYFWAERRFARALRFTPDHPLATAGLINAQIGAGLYVPAALGLHRLLTRQPEMIDVRYGPNLLPSRVRLNIAVRGLRELIDEEERDRALHGLLLAYLGHQMSEPELVDEGLKVARENSPNDALPPLLEAIWGKEEP